LRETIATLERQSASLAKGQSDSLQRVVDAKTKSPGAVRQSISRIPRRARAAGMTSLPVVGDPTKVAAELAKSKILLAELYLFNFNRPDSAMREYLDVFEFFPQTEYAPQAMYSLAYILGDAPATLSMRDSILQVLALQYSNTPQGHGAKRRLGQADTLAAPTLPKLLRDAEDYLVKQNNPQAALRLYEEFLQYQPETKLAAQSLYAMGWIYEHELMDNQQALVAYKKLIETYPDSPMARQVRRKVAAAEQMKDAPAKPEQIATTGDVALPPTTAAVDTLQAQPEDSAAAQIDIEEAEILSRRAKDLKQPPRPVEEDAIEDPEKEKKKTNDEEKDAKPPRRD
jgi:tetratricopeptide (TPR) repeat protein